MEAGQLRGATVTNEEWKRRCTLRIMRSVRKAGRILIGELKRRTHYTRGPGGIDGYSLEGWYSALDELDKSGKVVVERDADELEVAVRDPRAKEVLEVKGSEVRLKYRTNLGCKSLKR